jgi:hypothetical protein
VYQEQRDANRAGSGTARVFIHPRYDASNITNDIALIRLTDPFMITPYIQTVGLPRSPRQPGVVGTVATFSQTEPNPPGQLAIFRAPMPPVDSGSQFSIPASAASATLCVHDSGSGFVTVENGRATVRGIASNITGESGCLAPNGLAGFTDVFTFRDWILQTMGKSDTSLVGNTRVRWSGHAARGKMVMGCSNPNTPYVGPLNVVGVEEGAVCEGGQTQGIICQLDPNQASTKFGPPQIVGFTMRTTMANGTSEVNSLPFSSNLAQFANTFPAGVSREFTCQIGTLMLAPLTGSTPLILQRGVEPESTPPSPTGQEEKATAPK